MRLMGQIIPLGSTLKVQKSLNAGTYDTRRPREHLTPEEAERLIKTARKLGRRGERDSTMIRVAYEHGLRGSEVRLLLWSQLDIASRNPSIWINRLKGSASDSHPLYPEELKALRRLYKIAPLDSPYVFTAETGGPLSLQGFWAIVKRAGEASGIGFPIHPHMLRHSCGYRLRAQGRHLRDIQEFLAHVNIQNTVRYTKGGAERFRGFGR
jgi:integrase